VIVMDGIRRMYQDQEDIFYYITVHNENYVMPPIPEGEHIQEGIVKGMYKLSVKDMAPDRPRVQLFGSGAILREALRAQQILADNYSISSNVWSVTSYKTLHDEAQDCMRWNYFHPDQPAKKSFVENLLANEQGPFIASSDNMRALPEQIARWVPGDYFVLGTDGFGRSEARKELRRFFEVDAEHIVLAALERLALAGKVPGELPKEAIARLEIDPERPNPVKV
jgi:pyruvate dehydrogenase E1 component